MIKGNVEVFAIVDGEEKFLFREDNLLVRGSSELITDILTANISTEIENSSYSAIYDTSNYSIQAVSFGKSKEQYLNNYLGMGAHYFTEALSGEYNALNSIQTFHGSSTGYVSSFDSSSYLGSEISVEDRQLEVCSVTPYESYLSSVVLVEDFGQNKNAFFYGYNGASSAFLGCYPPASGVGFRLRNYYDTTGPHFFSGVYSGTFNSLSSMDIRGFLRTNYAYEGLSNSGRAIIYAETMAGGTSPTSGAFIESPVVNVKITMASGDVGMSQLYGGINNLGLWSLDLKKSLENSYPPYEWVNSVGVSDREFKLFSKKNILRNLALINDDGGTPGSTAYASLVINWRISLNIANYLA